MTLAFLIQHVDVSDQIEQHPINDSSKPRQCTPPLRRRIKGNLATASPIAILRAIDAASSFLRFLLFFEQDSSCMLRFRRFARYRTLQVVFVQYRLFI